MLQIFMGETTPQKRLEVGSTSRPSLLGQNESNISSPDPDTCPQLRYRVQPVYSSICSIVVGCVCAQDTGEWIPLMHFAEERLETPMELADPQACWPEQVAKGLLQLALDCTGKQLHGVAAYSHASCAC